MPHIAQGKDYNFFQRLTVSNANFNTDSDVIFNYKGLPSFSLINEGSGIVEYSFNGTTLHGDLVPGTPSSSMTFNGRGYSQIWFRIKSGSPSNVRIESAQGTLFLGSFAPTTITLNKPAASSTNSPTIFTNFGANATLNVKASVGNVLSTLCQNLNASMRYLQLHNTATVPAGGAVPVISIPIQGSTTTVIGSDFYTLAGVNFSTGIAFAFSTTSGTYTAGTASDQMTTVCYV